MEPQPLAAQDDGDDDGGGNGDNDGNKLVQDLRILLLEP